MQRAVARLVRRPHDAQGAVLALEGHLGVQLALELAERALDADATPFLRDLHSVGERDRHSSNTGHASFAPLPDVGEDLATEILLPGIGPGHDPVGG